MVEADVKAIWNSSLEYYSSYSYLQLLPTVCKIAVFLLKAGEGKLKVIL